MGPGDNNLHDFVTGQRERVTTDARLPFVSTGLASDLQREMHVEEAIEFAKHASAIQLERIQALTDGAVLAAEQVQDKRIEVLERGPEVSGTSLLMEFAITLILESPLAAKALQKLTTVVLRPIIKRRIAIAELRIRSSTLQLRKVSRTLSAPAALEAARQADLDVRRIAEELRQLHQSFDQMGTGSWRDYLIGAIKGGRAASAASGNEQPNSDPSDTPGVRVLSLAQSYASNQRMVASVDLASLEFWLRAGLVSADDLQAIFHWDALNVSLDRIRDESKRYYEALIWSLLLWQQAKVYREGLTKRSLTAPEQVFGNLADHTPSHLLHYWLYRFVDPSSGKQFADAAALRAGDKEYDRSVAALAQYMQKLARQADQSKIIISTTGILSGHP